MKDVALLLLLIRQSPLSLANFWNASDLHEHLHAADEDKANREYHEAVQGLAYVLGISDFLSSAGALCPPVGTSAGDVVNTVRLYVDVLLDQEGKARLRESSASEVTSRALLERWKCKK